MKRFLVSLAFISSLFLCAPVSGEPPLPEAIIESITYEKDDDNREKIVFKLNGAHIPKVFKIQGERPRVVFDFIDTRYSDLINRIADTQGRLIKGVRIGIHDNPPKTRVVVDLKAEEEYQFEQDFQIQENTLSITFYPSGSDEQEPMGPEPAEPPAKPAQAAALSAPDGPQPPDEQPPLPPGPPAEEEPDQPVAAAPAVEAAEDQPAAPVASTPALPAAAAEPAKDLEELLADAGSQPKAVVDPILSDVSFNRTEDNTEMVLFKLNDFYPPIVFAIEKGTPRVVCDFLDTKLDRAVRPMIGANGEFVSRIRVARHDNPEKVRVVLDLVPNRNYDLQQVFFKEVNLFVIVINEFEHEPAAAPAAVDVPVTR